MMATKTKTKKKVEESDQTFAPIKGSQSKKTVLLAKRMIRCNGHMHEIGLTSKGQLWIPSHTKKELEGFIMMGDLGNNPCKCAVVYDAWKRGNYKHSQIHDDFRREKIITDRLANRLLKHQNKSRAWPNCDIIFGTFYAPKADENGHYSWTNKPADKFAEFVAETVYRTLLHRGYSPKMITWEKGRTSIEMEDPGKNTSNTYNHNYGTIFSAHVSGHGYISPYVGGILIENCAMYETTPPAEIPWRMLIDQTEARLNYLMVTKGRTDRFDQRKQEFEKLAQARIDDLGKLPKHAKIETNKDKGTVTLQITHPNLTLPVANRLVKHYKETEDKVIRLLKHNRVRRGLWYRFPGKPSSGFGALSKRGDETNCAVAARPLDGETYEN
jgi:hypothetical protein